ncbi:unnamed protein product [Gongylonema pulchrum]|uniref:Adaptin_N domain-containing protein n=1 Tax=Gongylonema pulchrum TaxID=637853 RepID=A0A183DWI8_9BILA|nr:unnamed protein product [Gongylonema pulchrum]
MDIILRYLRCAQNYDSRLVFCVLKLLKETYENRSMDIILRYLRCAQNYDSRLVFCVLKYLSGLLVHRKLALDFVAAGGVELLVRVHRESVASVVVATCLYYLAYNVDAMQDVCILPEDTLDKVVE